MLTFNLMLKIYIPRESSFQSLITNCNCNSNVIGRMARVDKDGA